MKGKFPQEKQQFIRSKLCRLSAQLHCTSRRQIGDDARGDEYQQLLLATQLGGLPKQPPDYRDIAEERDLVDIAALFLRENTPKHHRTAILDLHIGFYMLGVDRIAVTHGDTARVFCYIYRQDDIAVRCDLRRHL